MTTALKMLLTRKLTQMADIDIEFEVIDSSSVEVSRRRKSKYTHKLWEYDDEKGQARYLLAVARLMERRGCDYAEELRDKISQRHIYEIEMESVFHSDEETEDDVEYDDILIEDDDDDDIEIPVPENLNDIVNVKYDNFYVMTPFYYDKSLDQVVARVPAGVVSKKMSLNEIYQKFLEISLTPRIQNADEGGSEAWHRKYFLLRWLGDAETLIEEYALHIGWSSVKK
jgi:hypothetical protein